MEKFDYILFDLDGTLTDSGEGIINAVKHSLSTFGIEEERENLKRFIGPPLRDSFKNFYGFDNNKSTEGIVNFREYYIEKGIYENRLYDGIEDVLKALKNAGKHLIIATSKPEAHAEIVADYFKITDYFDLICGADIEETRADKAGVIKYALEKAEIKDLSKAVMIGDREFDILGAKENNIKGIGVLYGYGDVIELTQARAYKIFKTPEEILELI